MFCPRKFRVIGSWSSMFIMQIFSLELSLQIRHRFYFWFFSAKIYQMLPAIYPSGIFPTLKLNWVISIKVDWCKICLIHPKTNWSAGSGSNHDYHSRVSFCQFTCYLILEIYFSGCSGDLVDTHKKVELCWLIFINSDWYWSVQRCFFYPVKMEQDCMDNAPNPNQRSWFWSLFD